MQSSRCSYEYHDEQCPFRQSSSTLGRTYAWWVKSLSLSAGFQLYNWWSSRKGPFHCNTQSQWHTFHLQATTAQLTKDNSQSFLQLFVDYLLLFRGTQLSYRLSPHHSSTPNLYTSEQLIFFLNSCQTSVSSQPRWCLRTFHPHQSRSMSRKQNPRELHSLNLGAIAAPPCPLNLPFSQFTLYL